MYNDELTKKLAETAKRIMAGESVEAIEEATGDKEAYQKFFNDTLKKYGVKSPSELKGDDKKKFFDEIDAGWKGDDEKPEKNESVELEEAAKISGKDAYKWLTSNKVFDDEDFTNPPSFDDAVKSYRGSGPGLDAFINLAKKHGGKKSTDGWGWIGGARNFYDKVLVPAAKGYASVEESVEELEEQTPDFHVKYAKSKRGPIQVTKFMTLDKAKKFLSDREAEGYRGIISKDGKPVKESAKSIFDIKPDSKKWTKAKSRGEHIIRGKMHSVKTKVKSGDALWIHPFDGDRHVAAIDKNDTGGYFFMSKYSIDESEKLESVEELEESTEDLGEGKKKPKLTDKQIINHPDANVVLTISHDGVEKAVADLRKGDYDDDFYIAVDSGHKKYSKIYVLDVQDISESTDELEDDEGDVEEGLIGNLIKKGAKRFLTRKGRNDARAKKLKKLKSKSSEIRRSKQLKKDIKTAKKDIRKARRESTEELEEAKIDLNKKFNTSDAAFDYFHSFAVADQAKTDQEVEKSKKKFAKNTLGFWMQNLTDTLKGMGISEETELDLTEEEEEEIVASILDTIPDAEAAADDDNHPDEDDMLATLDTTTGYKVVDNLPEETERLDARRREFREKIRKLAYEKAKKMIKGISDADDEEEKVEGVDKPLEVQKYEAIGAVSVSHVKEEIEESTEELEEKRKSKSDYEIYHDSYTSALSEVLDLVARNGYKVDEDLWFTNVSSGPRKPSAGKTNSFTLELEKGGKPTRKVVSFQVYGLESGRYELNAYIS